MNLTRRRGDAEKLAQKPTNWFPAEALRLAGQPAACQELWLPRPRRPPLGVDPPPGRSPRHASHRPFQLGLGHRSYGLLRQPRPASLPHPRCAQRPNHEDHPTAGSTPFAPATKAKATSTPASRAKSPRSTSAPTPARWPGAFPCSYRLRAVLPLLMIATQLLVAKITPSPAGAGPRMARWMSVMPLLFGFVLYRQPSALMLYGLTSSLRQLGQQRWLGQRYA
jgi:membrane protein insertase Oxa1/YidC/SpoIIIJ